MVSQLFVCRSITTGCWNHWWPTPTVLTLAEWKRNSVCNLIISLVKLHLGSISCIPILLRLEYIYDHKPHIMWSMVIISFGWQNPNYWIHRKIWRAFSLCWALENCQIPWQLFLALAHLDFKLNKLPKLSVQWHSTNVHTSYSHSCLLTPRGPMG